MNDHIGDTNEMSDTSRTDKESFFPHDSKYKVCDADFARTLERELNDGIDRIKRLLAERDTARLQADQKHSLREEFRELLGTDDIEQGVAVVNEMKQCIKRLEEALTEIELAMKQPASNHRLMQISGPARQVINIIKKAKEAKP